MYRYIIRLKIFLEVVLFLLTTGIASYFSENHDWKGLTFLVVIAAGLFGALKYGESARFTNWLRQLVAQQHEFATVLGRWGIVRAYNMQDEAERRARNTDNVAVIKQGSSFCLSGTTGASYIDAAVHRHWDALRPKLEAGCSFKFLLTNPLCESKRLRNKLNGVEELLDPKLNLGAVTNLIKKYPHFEVRVTNELYGSVFYTESEMMYDPYHVGTSNDRLENYFLALRIKKTAGSGTGSDYYTQLRLHFDNLWQVAVPFDQFLTVNATKLGIQI